MAAKFELERYSGNPILSLRPDLPWANNEIRSPGAFKLLHPKSDLNQPEIIQMLFTAVGDGNRSTFGFAESTDPEGKKFKVYEKPVYSPGEEHQRSGIEDPRMVNIRGRIFVTYTTRVGNLNRIVAASTPDFQSWQEHGLLLPDINSDKSDPKNCSSAGALFPELIRGEYRMLFGDFNILMARSKDFTNWRVYQTPLLQPRAGYHGEGYVRGGGSPIKTEQGWLYFYNGGSKLDDEPGSPRPHSFGAVLLDSRNPRKILKRSRHPLLTPLKSNKTNTVSVCSAVRMDNGVVNIYYDESGSICLATGSEEEITKSLAPV